MRRTGRVIVVFFLVFFCMAGLWLFQSFRESRVVKTKKEYRNVYITDVKQQKVEGIWRGQKKTWQLRSAVSKEKISGVADLIEEQGKVVKVRKKPDMIQGKILRIMDKKLQIENYGFVSLDAELCVYHLKSDGIVTPGEVSELSVGESEAKYVAASGKICAVLLYERAEKTAKIRVILQNEKNHSYDFPNVCFSATTGYTVVAGKKKTHFDASEYKVKLAAEVKNFVAKERMDFKAAKRMESFSQYAVAAAKEAFEDAGLDMAEEDPYRIGTIIGSGIGGLECHEKNYKKLQERGPGRVNPLMIPLMISNMAAGNVSIQLGLKGKCTDVVTACASGANSIGDAMRAIQYGDLDVCVAGGTEASICPSGVAGFTALTALSCNPDPASASRPFDKDRDGFVIGEGAGIVVLEELEHAKARGARIYAEMAGYGSTGDAYHITSPAEDGSGAGMAMKFAMKEAGIQPEQVDYINAHGTSTHHNDLFESRAIRYALGKAAETVVINSTKSMVGHMLGAAGAVEVIVCVKSIEDQFIHQTIGTEHIDPECGLNYAVGSPVEKKIDYAMSNSLGFGGHNVSLIVKRYEE